MNEEFLTVEEAKDLLYKSTRKNFSNLKLASLVQFNQLQIFQFFKGSLGHLTNTYEIKGLKYPFSGYVQPKEINYDELFTQDLSHQSTSFAQLGETTYILLDENLEYDVSISEIFNNLPMEISTASSYGALIEKLVVNKENILISKKSINEYIASIQVRKNSPKSCNSPVGKSPNKSKAQMAAEELATELWKADIDQKIRMQDMCSIIYSRLYENYSKELPDQPKSLKMWIKNIAPKYASRGGAPSKNKPDT